MAKIRLRFKEESHSEQDEPGKNVQLHTPTNVTVGRKFLGAVF